MLNTNPRITSDIGEGNTWRCECGQVLGYTLIDPATGLECLHMKHKDAMFVVHGNAGHWVRRNCPTCSRVWVLEGKDDSE